MIQGGVFLSAQGTIVARVYTSNAMLPVTGASVAFCRRSTDGKFELLAFRITNFDGFTDALTIDTPEQDGRALTSSGQHPYSTVSMIVDQPGYDRIIVEDAQVFTGIQTLQEFMLIPTPQLPDNYSRTETFVVPAQTL